MEIFELRNGVRGISIPMEGRTGVVVEIMVKMGAKYEKKSEFGISHFLEHMAFKGTESWPKVEDLNKEIDSKGAVPSAETSEEMISYSFKTTADKLAWALNLLSEIVLKPKIPKNEVDKERGVIVEEIKMYRDNPLMGLLDEFMRYVLAKTKMGCWDVAGTVENVSRISRQGLIRYRDRYLNQREMLVVVAGGGFQISDVKSGVEKYFGGFDNQKARGLPKVEMIYNGVKELRIKKESVEQGHFIIGGEGISRGDKRKYIFRILEQVLAGSMSSRLYSELREKRGWAYYVYAQSRSLVEGGIFGIQTGVRKEKLEEAIKLVEKEIIGLSKSLKEEELERAKEQIVNRLLMGTDEMEFWTGMVGERALLENREFDLAYEIEKYRKVDLRQARDLAEEKFSKDRLRKLVVYR